MSGEGQDKNGDIAEASVPLNNGAEEPKKNPGLVSKFQALSTQKPPTKSPLGFLIGLLGLCCCLPAAACACGVLILGALVQLLPLAEIIVGIWYWPGSENCPQEDGIPLLLIIGGISTLVLVSVVSGFGRKEIKKRGKDDTKDVENQMGEEEGMEEIAQTMSPWPLLCCWTLLFSINIAWLIYGVIVICRSYSEVSYDDQDGDKYCHPALYRVLLWGVTLVVGPLLLSPVIACCACCAAAISASCGFGSK